VKVGCSTKVEKMKREQLPFREVMIASCAEQSFKIITMFLFLCSQSSEGWIGQEQAGSRSKVALCLYSENRGCDELLIQHRRFTSEGYLSRKHPGWTRLHLASSGQPRGGTQLCPSGQIA